MNWYRHPIYTLFSVSEEQILMSRARFCLEAYMMQTWCQTLIFNLIGSFAN